MGKQQRSLLSVSGGGGVGGFLDCAGGFADRREDDWTGVRKGYCWIKAAPVVARLSVCCKGRTRCRNRELGRSRSCLSDTDLVRFVGPAAASAAPMAQTATRRRWEGEMKWFHR